MSNSSPNAAQWVLLIVAALVGIWQFQKGLNAWRSQEQPKPLILFMFSWLHHQDRISDNEEQDNGTQPPIVQQTEGILNMVAGLFLALLPLIVFLVSLLG